MNGDSSKPAYLNNGIPDNFLCPFPGYYDGQGTWRHFSFRGPNVFHCGGGPRDTPDAAIAPTSCMPLGFNQPFTVNLFSKLEGSPLLAPATTNPSTNEYLKFAMLYPSPTLSTAGFPARQCGNARDHDSDEFYLSSGTAELERQESGIAFPEFFGKESSDGFSYDVANVPPRETTINHPNHPAEVADDATPSQPATHAICLYLPPVNEVPPCPNSSACIRLPSISSMVENMESGEDFFAATELLSSNSSPPGNLPSISSMFELANKHGFDRTPLPPHPSPSFCLPSLSSMLANMNRAIPVAPPELKFRDATERRRLNVNSEKENPDPGFFVNIRSTSCRENRQSGVYSGQFIFTPTPNPEAAPQHRPPPKLRASRKHSGLPNQSIPTGLEMRSEEEITALGASKVLCQIVMGYIDGHPDLCHAELCKAEDAHKHISGEWHKIGTGKGSKDPAPCPWNGCDDWNTCMYRHVTERHLTKHFCPVKDCEHSYSRLASLKYHLAAVHGYKITEMLDPWAFAGMKEI